MWNQLKPCIYTQQINNQAHSFDPICNNESINCAGNRFSCNSEMRSSPRFVCVPVWSPLNWCAAETKQQSPPSVPPPCQQHSQPDRTSCWKFSSSSLRYRFSLMQSAALRLIPVFSSGRLRSRCCQHWCSLWPVRLLIMHDPPPCLSAPALASCPPLSVTQHNHIHTVEITLHINCHCGRVQGSGWTSLMNA